MSSSLFIDKENNPHPPPQKNTYIIIIFNIIIFLTQLKENFCIFRGRQFFLLKWNVFNSSNNSNGDNNDCYYFEF